MLREWDQQQALGSHGGRPVRRWFVWVLVPAAAGVFFGVAWIPRGPSATSEPVEAPRRAGSFCCRSAPDPLRASATEEGVATPISASPVAVSYRPPAAVARCRATSSCRGRWSIRRALHVVRARMSRMALATLGMPMVNPDADGLVEVEMLVGDEGVAQSIRRAALVSDTGRRERGEDTDEPGADASWLVGNRGRAMKTYACLTVLVVGLASVAGAAAQDRDVIFFRSGPLDPRPGRRAASAVAGVPFHFELPVDVLAVEPFDVGEPVTGAPYSAEMTTEILQQLADGNRIERRSTSSVSRDGEGRVRREQQLAAIGPILPQGDVQIVTINDPVAKVHYSLDFARKMAIQSPMMFTKRLEGPVRGFPPAKVGGSAGDAYRVAWHA